MLLVLYCCPLSLRLHCHMPIGTGCMVVHIALQSGPVYELFSDMFVFCSHGFIDNLQLGGPTPIGARKAPLSEKYLSMMQEVALNEQVCCRQFTLLKWFELDSSACMCWVSC